MDIHRISAKVLLVASILGLVAIACEPEAKRTGQAAPAAPQAAPAAPAAKESPPAAPPARAPAETLLTVHVDKPGIRISPMLWGVFFEEINRAGDGGLYAEMVQNRSFEDADPPAAWSLLRGEGAEAKMSLDKGRPLNEKNPTALRIEITRAGADPVGVANEGFKGVPVRKGAPYVLSLYARRSDELKGPLAVRLESRDGKSLYASGKIEGVDAEWKKFTCALTASDTDPAARLVIAASGAGKLWLDMVSLFPKETWKGRPNGLRADLAEMLANLKLSFVRFPGGCFVEGNELKDAFRWKDTIGDIAERPGHWNLWGYRSTDGLGYHEYLQMCEDLGAEPLFVINCGMAHKDHVPMDQMGPWVQDALDAIEYANGPADSKWGALRAKAGHPAPFSLKYMEIGNENGGPVYQERYALFVDAIKAKYPAMRLVADEWGGTPKGRPIEIVDEHYYSSPEFFISQAAKYDAYKRDGPKIYVGEYAVTQGCGKVGNLRAALGEAVFMMGMERASDVVIMASYAPLFVNVGWRQWNPDAIQFDTARVCGTPSYWAQQMFGRHRGDVVLAAELQVPPAPAETKHGAIGLGTWVTQAEFKDLKIAQGDKVLFECDFAKGAEGWKTLHGEWKVQEGAYRQTTPQTDCRATTGDPSWADYTYSLKARKIGGAEGFLIMFQVQDDQNWLWWNLGGWGNSKHAIEQCRGGGKSPLGREVAGKIETGRWYDIRIELKGPQVRCFLDNQLVHEVTQPQVGSLYASASRAAGGEVILKVANVSDKAREVQVDLRGTAKVAASGTAIVLSSASPADENTLDEPKKVAPVTRAVGGLGPSFRHTFPAHSLTILRVTAGP